MKSVAQFMDKFGLFAFVVLCIHLGVSPTISIVLAALLGLFMGTFTPSEKTPETKPDSMTRTRTTERPAPSLRPMSPEQADQVVAEWKRSQSAYDEEEYNKRYMPRGQE